MTEQQLVWNCGECAMLDGPQRFFDTTDVDTMRRAYDAICSELGLSNHGDDVIRRDRIAGIIADIATPRDGDWVALKERVIRLLGAA